MDTEPTPKKTILQKTPARKKADEFMSQVETDVETPVAAAKDGMAGDANVDLILESKPAPVSPIPGAVHDGRG